MSKQQAGNNNEDKCLKKQSTNIIRSNENPRVKEVAEAEENIESVVFFGEDHFIESNKLRG